MELNNATDEAQTEHTCPDCGSKVEKFDLGYHNQTAHGCTVCDWNTAH